ncbi:hypothetical protein PUR23_14565 [Methylorubrum populi]|jgi:hypothetical protein|uniref:Uncharacterized protein n=2 Tax=Methylobacteriaceae TaxID=119045 RepID=A0A160PLC3_9HYPH|nr:MULTISPECIES: hypothetical protein [Methylobacteriaceae]MBY0256395.1 hypothetical protein [Methylobacterium sp.]MCB4802771.1 hypothetical protein [Methylobacterium brachiatum]MDQ0543405.1 hypothetical protein [Methylobacterium brachiatum]OAH40022.1 hypothetical protein AX289_31935 [Methylorubrum populi]BAU94006.1 hypothetical protein MPPM_5401 [Methylorubrum populi]
MSRNFRIPVAALALMGALTALPATSETLKELSVAGSDVELSPFETRQLPVATAKDKKTGRTFNVVKLPNGKMMAMQSIEKLGDRLSYADDSEMMYGNHTGSTR